MYTIMVRNDDLLDTILFAARYVSSNMTAVLVGGIVIALSFLVIGLPFFLGYITRCMKEIVQGNGVMPQWDDIGQMFVDGVRMTMVFFAYVIIYCIIGLVPAVPVIVFYLTNAVLLLSISLVIMALTLALVASVFGVVFFASWAIYANTGSVRKAINVRRVIEFVSFNPSGYLVSIVASAAIAALGVISMSLFVTIPWAVFVMCAAVTFVYAKFYQNTLKSSSRALDWLK
jgi:hypothetical protein